jgi:carboxypeptidase D
MLAIVVLAALLVAGQDASSVDSDASISYEFKHHDYADMISLMERYHKSYPEMTELFSVGKSVKGKELKVLRYNPPSSETQDNLGLTLLLFFSITKDLASVPSKRPKMKWVGNMHGNEVVGREILLNFIQVNGGCDVYKARG